MKRHIELVAFFLLCCTLISVHLTSGLYARYTVSESGQNQAGVIRFGNVTLTEEGDFNSDKKLVVIPGVPLNYQVTIDFTGSEAAVFLFVEAITGQWKIDGNRTFIYPVGENKQLVWKIDSEWEALDGVPGVYYQCLQANEIMEQKPVIAGDGLVTVPEDLTKTELQSIEPDQLSMKFHAYVVQANGFADSKEAWNSIKNKGVNANEKN